MPEDASNSNLPLGQHFLPAPTRTNFFDVVVDANIVVLVVGVVGGGVVVGLVVGLVVAVVVGGGIVLGVVVVVVWVGRETT